MGKERSTKRFSRHVKAADFPNGTPGNENGMEISSLFPSSSLPITILSGNQLQLIQQQPSPSSSLPDDTDTPSTTKPLTKKAKRVIKHQQFLEKLEASKGNSKKKSETVRMKIESATSTSTSSPFKLESDMLSSLLTETDNKRTKDGVPKKQPSKMTSEVREKITLKETKQIKAVLSHPVFKQSPLATIREHLQNSIAQEAKQREKHEQFQKQLQQQQGSVSTPNSNSTSNSSKMSNKRKPTTTTTLSTTGKKNITTTKSKMAKTTATPKKKKTSQKPVGKKGGKKTKLRNNMMRD